MEIGMRIPALVGLFTSLIAVPAAGQSSWPDKPVRIIIGAPAGGATEQVVRPIAEALSARLGQQFVIDPRPGAGGNIAAEAAARSAPDGHVLLVPTVATHGIGPSLYKKLGYSATKDFVGITKLADFANVIFVARNAPYRTLPALISYARANPSKVNHGSTGVGTSTQLTAVLLAQAAGITMTHVPYKGSGALTTAVLSGEIEVGVDNLPGLLGQIKGGAIHALAVTTSTRHPDLPDVPTVAEAGVPGFSVSSWYGLSAPAGTAPAIVQRIADEIGRIQQTPELRARYAKIGATPAFIPTAEFDAFIRGEIARWAPVVVASGATID